MGETKRRSRSAERGSITLPAIVAIGIMMVGFVVVAQFAVWIYADGALHLAAEEAARAASSLDADHDACRRHFDHVRSQLLGGALGDGVSPVRCTATAEVVRVAVSADFESWIPLMPGWEIEVAAVAVRETEPR